MDILSFSYASCAVHRPIVRKHIVICIVIADIPNWKKMGLAKMGLFNNFFAYVRQWFKIQKPAFLATNFCICATDLLRI